jgi:hypothetical protein
MVSFERLSPIGLFHLDETKTHELIELSGVLPPWNGESSGFRWKEEPPGTKGSMEYIWNSQK